MRTARAPLVITPLVVPAIGIAMIGIAMIAMATFAVGCLNETAVPPCNGPLCRDAGVDAEEGPRIFVDPPFGVGFDCGRLGCSTEKRLTVENRGTGSVRVVLARLSVGSSNDFVLRRADEGPLPVDDSTAVNVRPDTSLPLIVTYTPTDGASDAATLWIDWYDGELPFEDAVIERVELPLTARVLGPPQAELGSGRVNFGYTAPGTTVSGEVVVHHSGEDGILSVGPLVLEEESGMDVSIFRAPTPDAWDARLLNPGEEARFAVEFAPDAAHVFRNAALLATNDEAGPQLRVLLHGTGDGEPRLHLSEESADVDLGDVRVGVLRSRDIVIENTGGAPLQVDAAVVAGTTDGFSVAPASIAAVAPLQSAVFAVTFAPTRGGDVSGTLRLQSNDPTSSSTEIPLHGFGNSPELIATPEEVQFEDIVLGWSSAPQEVSIQNGGFGELTITSIEFEVGSSAQLRLVNVPRLPIKLAPGEAPLVFSTLVMGTSIGAANGTLIVGSDAVGGADVTRIPLSGRVLSCEDGCPVAHGEPSCASGSCAVDVCDDRYHDADADVGTGCECAEDPIPASGGLLRDIPGACDGLNIGPIHDCSDPRQVSFSGSLHADSDVDLFFVRANDAGDLFCNGFGDAFYLNVDLTDRMPGMQVCMRRGGEGTGCGGELFRTCAPGHLEYRGVGGAADTSDVTIWVEWANRDLAACGEYTLRVSANDI